MTTLNHFLSGYNFIDLGEDLEKIDPIDVKKDGFTFKLPVFFSTPLAILKNTNTLFRTFLISKSVKKHVLKFQNAFLIAGENDKVELYASLSHLVETLDYVIESKDLTNPTGGLLTRLISEKMLSLSVFLHKSDDVFYKLAYPESQDPKDPLFVKEILEAHSNSDFKF